MSCQPNNPTRTCSISNGIGKQTWNGNNWESCIVASCISWYSVSNWNCSVNQSIQQQTTTTNQLTCSSDQHIENNTCISNIRSCGISNGIGKQTWNGNNWDSCIVASCNSWYSVSNWNCSVKQPMEQPNTTTTTTTTNQLTCSSDQHIENNTCI